MTTYEEKLAAQEARLAVLAKKGEKAKPDVAERILAKMAAVRAKIDLIKSKIAKRDAAK